MALVSSAHQVHGMRRAIISLTFWLGAASPSNRRCTMTVELMTTAMPRMCSDCAIGGNPGTLPSRYTAASWAGLPESHAATTSCMAV